MSDYPTSEYPSSVTPPPLSGPLPSPPARGGRRVSRRQFVAGAAGTAGAGAMGLAVSRHSWASPAKPKAVAPAATGSGAKGGGILVLVGLFGGNDGLNTVIPYKDSAYLSLRPHIGYQPNEVLALSDGLALHPNLTGLKALWDAKQLAIVRGVGYPTPNRSHFRSMDIWQSAVPDSQEITGSIGRWLDVTGTDPLRALSVGPTIPRGLAGAKTSGSAVPLGALRLPGGPDVASGFAAIEKPFAMPLPNVARSGFTPKRACAPPASRRNPVTISSKMTSAPARWLTAQSSSR